MEAPRAGYDEKLAHILSGAAAVFAEKGYHRASMRDVGRKTGVSLAGLYHYVSGKEELLFLIQDRCFATVLEQLDRLLDGETDPEERLRLLLENHLGFFVNAMDEMKVLSHEAGSLTGEYRQRVNAKKKRYTQLCEEILASIRPGEDQAIDRRVATFALFGMMNWIYTWYRPERDEPVTDLVDDLQQLFLRGYLGLEASSLSAATEEWEAANGSLPSRESL